MQHSMAKYIVYGSPIQDEYLEIHKLRIGLAAGSKNEQASKSISKNLR